MLNIAICDDEIHFTGQLDMLLKKITSTNSIEIDTDVFWKGADIVQSIEQGNFYDIIFLDIEMAEKDGITTAKEIRQYDKNVLIIYITSHENYMKSSFDVRPFRFLVKPINEQEFINCFHAALDEICNEDFYFRYRYQRIYHKIPIKKILYFESCKRKISITTTQKTFDMYGKLNDIEESLKNCKFSFFRVHQSFLVNYQHIEEQAYDYITMDNGKKISISENRRKMISQQYCNMEDAFHVDL